MVAPWRAEISGNYWKGVRRGGGRRCARNAIDGRPRASPRPRPELDRPKPIITASERELREISRPRMNMGSTLLQKKARPRPGFSSANRLLAGLGLGGGLRRLGFLRGLCVSLLGRLRGRGGRLSGRSRLPFGSGRLRFLRLSIGARRESGGDQRNEQLLGHGFSWTFMGDPKRICLKNAPGVGGLTRSQPRTVTKILCTALLPNPDRSHTGWSGCTRPAASVARQPSSCSPAFACHSTCQDCHACGAWGCATTASVHFPSTANATRSTGATPDHARPLICTLPASTIRRRV